MIGFLTAHGFDPGPTQRPILAGFATGAIACVPAAVLFVAAGSFRVLAHDIFQASAGVTAVVLAAAFVAAGALYGILFRRGANDRRGGWLFGLAYGFLLWMTAPVLILPLVGRPIIAAGEPAMGFLGAFLLWGLIVGLLFPYVHKPLHADLDGMSARFLNNLGPSAAAQRGARLPGSQP